LKRITEDGIMDIEGSLPTRERGLKHNAWVVVAGDRHVAPYAGAWIETEIAIAKAKTEAVAPYAGAWIETIKLW